MPGIGIRLWHPFIRAGEVEVPATILDTVVVDPVGLNGFTAPYKTHTGNMVLRVVARANTSTRPLTLSVKWNNISMTERAYYVDSGLGGCLVGIWTLENQEPAEGNIVFTSNTNNVGCAGIRMGETQAAIAPIAAGAAAGYSVNYEMTSGNGLLIVGGCTDSEANPLSSEDFDIQRVGMIPPKTDLPNRTNGICGLWGMTRYPTSDNLYEIVPAKQIDGVIAAIEIQFEQAVKGLSDASEEGQVQENDFLKYL